LEDLAGSCLLLQFESVRDEGTHRMHAVKGKDMKIFFDVPHIGTHQNGWAQRGPTCWYYATKMVLKFHEKLDPLAGDLYKNMKALSLLRKLVTQHGTGTELHLRHIPEAVARYREEYELKNREQATREVVLRSVRTKLSDPSTTRDVELMQRKAIALENAGKLAAGRLDILKRFDALAMSLPPAKGDWTMEYARAFFPRELFEEIPYQQGKLTDRTVIHDLLRRWGPLIVCGDLLSAVPSHGEIYHEVTAFQDGKHAILLTGIDTHSGMVEYRDPNFSNRICWCKFEKLICNVTGCRTDRDTEWVFLAVRCNHPGPCEHVRRKAFDKTYPERQAERDAQSINRAHETAMSAFDALGLGD
jgi:hypothetical protein